MNFVDLIIALFALALAAIGYERGLIASGLPLAGFVLGAAIGGRLGPALLEGGGESAYAPLITVLAGLLLGATFAIAVEGFAEALSSQFSRGTPAAFLDGMGGAALLASLGLLLAWAFGAAALNSPGPGERDLRHALQSSRILTALNGLLAALGAAAQRAAAHRPHARHQRPERERRSSRAGDRRRPRRATGRRQRGQGPRHRLRARHRGLGVGGRPRFGGDQRTRRRG